MSLAYEKTILRSPAFDRMVEAAKGQLQKTPSPPSQQKSPAKALTGARY